MRCPSEDWDKYIDGEEKQIVSEIIGELNKLAEKLYIANPEKNPYEVYTDAAKFIEFSNRVGYGRIVDHLDDGDEVKDFWTTWSEDLFG